MQYILLIILFFASSGLFAEGFKYKAPISAKAVESVFVYKPVIEEEEPPVEEELEDEFQDNPDYPWVYFYARSSIYEQYNDNPNNMVGGFTFVWDRKDGQLEWYWNTFKGPTITDTSTTQITALGYRYDRGALVFEDEFYRAYKIRRIPVSE